LETSLSGQTIKLKTSERKNILKHGKKHENKQAEGLGPSYQSVTSY